MTDKSGSLVLAAAIGCLALFAMPAHDFGPETTDKKSIEEAGAGPGPQRTIS